ncbi:conserved unknown protein [Ectocarpus siliculosus]|uniref:CSC1/OSCA1-like 7TM region domain-containing protein n=1 Tax=Ectocarpus siliculosus TaxID=2880 RepID=D7FXS7_ECTSI|nr:conserved unknown protein [Ectocarpus siliculosus]|eukprot:CBJ32340.1 conserved unknown protein [Ectocarpus siliculosus]
MAGDDDEDKSGRGNVENETTAAAEEDRVSGTAADDQKSRNSSAREEDEKASNRGSDDGSAKSDKDADEAASPTEDKDEGSDGESRENSTGEASVSKGSDGGGTSAGNREKQSGEGGAGSRSNNSVVSEKVGDVADDGDAEKSEDEGGESKGGSTSKTSEDPPSGEEKESGDPEPNAQGGESGDSATSASTEKGKDSEAAKNEVGKSDGSQGTKLEKGVAGEGGALAIDVATANGEKNVDGGPASDIASKESSCVEEDIDEMEVDLDKPWEKPSTERAKRAGKRMIWNNGMRYYFSTSIKEIGSMGVGMYLYFWMVRIVAIMFCICAFLSIPAMVLNHEGNAGMAISETDVDSLGLVALSFGNQGLNPDLVVESGCISSNGTVDCTGETVKVMGEAKDVLWVGSILVGGEILIAIFFVFFIVILSERLKAKIDEIDDANVTPGDYTVMVRGLPADVTKEEVAPSVVEYAELGTGASAFGMGVCTVLLCVLSVYAIVEGCGIGRPRKRDTPLQEWEKGRKQREKNKIKAAASSSKYSAAPGKVIPVETAPDAAPAATGAAGGDGVIAKEFDGTAAAAAAVAADGSAGEMSRLEEGVGGGGGGEAGGLTPPLDVPGVSPAQDAKPPEDPPKRGFPDERLPDPLPCQSCLNTHDKSFVGGWVADVVLGNPVGDVLMGFMDQEEALAEISKARTVVRQMKTLGKAKKLAKAEAKLAKLKAKEEALMAATRKKQDPAALESISVAFVTFEHEESKRRCLEDYRYSRRGFCRRFQPVKLQLSRKPADEEEQQQDGQTPPARRGRKKKPRPQRWRLKVFQAPEPSDVKWENLDVTPTSRKLRRAVTSLVCVVLLILSFAIIYLAQTEQAKLQEQIPALDTCEETIPAVVFGTYDFPLDAALQRDDSMDSSCADGSFYLAFAANATDPDSSQLDYDNLPPIFSADGTNVSRASFVAANDADQLCDDPCQPASGGSTCRALSCYEDSWEVDYGCVSYPQSTMIGCFCLDAVVTSFQEHGLVDGAKVVAREQGEVCAPFLRDYAKANAIKILAVMSVVIVNTLLTSVMGKLAKFERHVSLSDFTSTVTAKLALAQFLNTALIVIIVNAGYTGGGLGFLQDLGVLAGEYNDFERSWYATVGVAVAMTMLINVVVPHATTLVGEIIVNPVKRLFKRRSVATQAQMNSLYKPPKFDMESRYAFLLQVLGVSLLYSGGIPILYLFASFSFATNFVVDKFWIIKLAQQPPMYTAALAKMFVGVLPIALLVHMSTACYMLGNVDILNIGFVSDEAQTIAEALDGQGMSGLVADHVLRKHVFPLFVLTALFIALYVAYKIVGDPLLQIVKGGHGSTDCSAVTRMGYTAEFFRVLGEGEKIDADELQMGWVESEQNGKKVAKWICLEDGPGPRGVKYKSGVPRQTWQVIAEIGQYNYVMEESDHAGVATRYMATAGFLSPRMKEREQAKQLKMTNKLAVAVEEGTETPGKAAEASETVPTAGAAAPPNEAQTTAPPAAEASQQGAPAAASAKKPEDKPAGSAGPDEGKATSGTEEEDKAEEKKDSTPDAADAVSSEGKEKSDDAAAGDAAADAEGDKEKPDEDDDKKSEARSTSERSKSGADEDKDKQASDNEDNKSKQDSEKDDGGSKRDAATDDDASVSKPVDEQESRRSDAE